MDSQRIEKAVLELILAIGENKNREGLDETPKRVAKAFEKLFGGYSMQPSQFLTYFDSEDYDEMIIVKDIEFYSFCEHHMLPFWGRAHIGYIPSKKILGLSKLPRLVEMYARRLQNQERLTKQIAETLMEELDPKGVGIVLEAKHFCMMARGVEKQQSSAITSTMLGIFRKNEKTRAEFLRLIGS